MVYIPVLRKSLTIQVFMQLVMHDCTLLKTLRFDTNQLLL